jgi:hypothetical protein
MIVSVLDALADGQAVTVTADSNIIDTLVAGRDLTMADDLFLVVQVDTTFTAGGAATMDVEIKSSDASNFGSGVDDTKLAAAIPVATLVAGYIIYRGPVIGLTKRYNKATFTVATGPMTAGAISAFFTDGVQKWKAYAAPNQA